MTDLPAYVLVALRVLMAATLYGFLTMSLILIWRELKRTAQQPHRDPVPPIRLRFPDHPALEKNPSGFTRAIFIGRDPLCECSIPDETVSGSHARLWYADTQWWLEDLDSRNGTFLNEIRVESPVVIAPDDVILCGKVKLIVEIDEDGFGKEFG